MYFTEAGGWVMRLWLFLWLTLFFSNEFDGRCAILVRTQFSFDESENDGSIHPQTTAAHLPWVKQILFILYFDPTQNKGNDQIQRKKSKKKSLQRLGVELANKITKFSIHSR